MGRRKGRRRRPPAGSRPGTLVVPEQKGPVKARVFIYDAEGIEERDLSGTAEIEKLTRDPRHFWLDVAGLGDVEFLREMGRVLNLHPLALEDVVHSPQRPKAEEYDEHLLLISQTYRDPASTGVDQLSLLVAERFVVTFHEGATAVLKPVIDRLRDGKGPMRKSGPAYLAYAILDSVVDGYFPVAEVLVDRIEDLEGDILSSPQPEQLEMLNGLKGSVLSLRRNAWAQRDAINRMMRDMEDFSDRKMRIYLRDIHDHCSQVVETCDTQREVVNGLLNMYLSVVSNRMNEVMKVLTIMASIFIPLTFLAGIYGMNFSNMPELQVAWAYPTLLATMVVTAVGMLIYFRRKGWIGGSGREGDGDGKG